MSFPDIHPDTSMTWQAVPGDWRRPTIQERYLLYWDPEREYGQLLPRPTKEDIPAFYQVDGYHTHQVEPDQSAFKQGISQKIMTRVAWAFDKSVDPDHDWWRHTLGPTPLKLLEVGCGRGAHAMKIASLGHTVRGVEPDEKARQAAQAADFEVVEGSAEALPETITSDRFDTVAFMHVLEHCIDPYSALKNAAALLNKDGLVIVEVPNNACIGCKYYGPLWSWLDVPRHLNFFTEKSLRTLFEALSLDIVSVDYRGYTRQFSTEWKTTQAQIARALGAAKDKRTQSANYWVYLAKTAFSAPSRKYDSVRIVGRLRS